MDDDRTIFNRSFDSLTTLADAISEALRCPVTIEDAHHRLIAYSTHDPQTDPVRIATIIGRRVPEKVIRELWQNGIMGALNGSDDPVRVPAIDGIGFGDRIAIAIRRKNEVLGYIWALETGRRLDPNDLAQLKKAAEAVKANILELEMKSRKTEKEYQEFFWQLLTGHYLSGEMIQAKADKLGVTLPLDYYVIVFEFESEITEETHRQIRYHIHTNPQDKVALHIINGKQLILLSGQADEASIRQIRNRLSSSSVNAGVSLSSGQYAEVEKRYQEAMLVLRIKKYYPEEMNATYRYEDVGFYQFMPRMAEERREHYHENARIRRLKAYDREHNSDLMRTLDVFLTTDSNAKKTAEILHIHTNTLTYRLKRIEEIGELDLDDMNQKVSLYLELRLARFTGQPLR